jgi:hypothetical protein
MAIHRPTYATRRMVKSATDITTTAEFDAQIDSALESAADEVDSLCHRRFYNIQETAFFDWPNFQRAYPWRIWLEGRELATVTAPVPVVTSGATVIPAGSLLWGPWNYAPPFRKVEINRSTSASFGLGSTPQKDVSILGLFGYWAKTRPAGALAAAVTDTTSTTITVTDSSLADAGDVLTIGTETLLVADTAMADTGQAQSGSGCSTASDADNQLTVADGTSLHGHEVIGLDAERMLITSITGNVATVQRAYDGTVLATHTNAEVFALRALTVTRGGFGSTAATHSNAAPITAALVPGDVRELALAEALNTVFQKTSAYARTIGENTRVVPGGSLPDLRSRVMRGYGRQARSRVV